MVMRLLLNARWPEHGPGQLLRKLYQVVDLIDYFCTAISPPAGDGAARKFASN
jgi:hypothetical protein